MTDARVTGHSSTVTDTCPRCGCLALLVEAYRDPGIDRMFVQAFCTSCGLIAREPQDAETRAMG